jgi:hypothetical protein
LVTPGTFTLDGLDGVDTLNMGTSLRSSYVFTKTADGAVHVDSVSGASGVLHATLYNMELLVFNSKKDTLDLRTYFANNAPSGEVTITGQLLQGQKLTAKSTLSDADGLGTLTYQWLADGVLIKNATAATLTLTEAQVGKEIAVTVSYVDGHGTAESVTSALTDAVANLNDAPAGGLQVTGIAKQGQTLAVSSTLTDADGLGTLAYQWLANGVAISGAVDSQLLLTEQQVGQKISVEASYVDGHGNAEAVASSATVAVANVNDLPTGTVQVRGRTSVGETLSADVTALADADGLGSLAYQWLADATLIPSATQSDLLLSTDLFGRLIQVQVRYTDGHGTLESVLSAATAAVGSGTSAGGHALEISGQISYWRDAQLKLPAVEMNIAGESAQSDQAGGISLVLSDAASAAAGAGVIPLALAKAAPVNAAAASITLNDVLSALKIYLGKNLPAAYSSSYNCVAADFDANGRVDLTDILGLLKFYLGKNSASALQPSWVFIDRTDYVHGSAMADLQITASNGLDISKSNALPHVVDHDFALNNSIDIVGVLRGDVDGSWTP